MSFRLPSPDPLPPRLSMDEYVEFVASAFAAADADQVARQKELEEKIATPFRIPAGEPHHG